MKTVSVNDLSSKTYYTHLDVYDGKYFYGIVTVALKKNDNVLNVGAAFCNEMEDMFSRKRGRHMADQRINYLSIDIGKFPESVKCCSSIGDLSHKVLSYVMVNKLTYRPKWFYKASRRALRNGLSTNLVIRPRRRGRTTL